MRNPNGYGSAYRLKGNRRKPFIARITIGWNDSGKQLYHTLGYFKSQPEAMGALADYNKNPLSIESTTVTFAELYEKWSKEKFNKISQSNIKGYKAAYNISEPLHNMKFTDIKKIHLQSIVDNCDKSHATLRKIKVLFNQIYKYAFENDIALKDYSKFVELRKDESESTRKPFTKNEIQKLWDNLGKIEFIDIALIMIYSGLRPGELILIETGKVDTYNRIMRGGIKTKAGINRIIPINRKILPLVKNRLVEGNRFLIVNSKGMQFKYSNLYDDKWKRIMELLEMEHKPHDCRHTFATLMDNAGANKLSIKRILGHASRDITDKVYTHKNIEELKKAVDLI